MKSLSPTLLLLLAEEEEGEDILKSHREEMQVLFLSSR